MASYKIQERTISFLFADAIAMEQVDAIIAKFKDAGLVVAESKLVYPSMRRLRQILPNPNGRWGMKTGRKAVEGLRERGKDPLQVYGTVDWKMIARKIVENLKRYYASGPILALVLQGDNAVHIAHKLTGSTSPTKARQGTIRNTFSMDDYDFANAAGRPCMKRVHTASNEAEARAQIRWLSKVPSYKGPVSFKGELFVWLRASGEVIPPGTEVC